jgi:hypothetical protein
MLFSEVEGASSRGQVLYDFGKAIDDGKEIRIIFCDISKAFDRVWHKGLLYKLKSIGIDDTVLKILPIDDNRDIGL